MPDWRAYVRDRLPPLTCSAEREAEIVEELAVQIQDIYDAAIRRGASVQEAEARVQSEIVDWRALARDLERAEDPLLTTPRAVARNKMEPAMRRWIGGQRLVEILRDARLSTRALKSQPFFALTTICIFALGIGATAVVFSLVHSVLLSPLPYREPDRLAIVVQVIPEIAAQIPKFGVNPRSFTAWEKSCRTSCESLGAVVATQSALTGIGEPRAMAGAKVSAGFFEVLGTPPALGRSFTVGDDVPGAARVVIVTHAFWQGRLAGDPAVLGRLLTLDGVPVEIVGVLPATFRLPELPQLSGPVRNNAFEFFKPMAWPDELRRSWGEFDNVVIARPAKGVSVQAMESELSAITRDDYARASIHPYAVARPLIDGVTADARRPLWLVLGTVATALLIGCANVAALLGSRWTTRQRELAIRTALGASRWRVVQFVAVEGLVLAGVGGMLGYALAAISLRTIVAMAPAAVPRLDEVRLDTTTLLVIAAVTLACALISSVVPAWRAARVDPGDTLKAGSLTMSPGRRWTAIRAWLVGGEVALTTILLVVGGLLVASLINVLWIDRGFSTTSLVAADLELPTARYPDAASRARFFDALLESLRDAPGVHGAGLSRRLPLEGDATIDVFVPVGDSRPEGAQPVGNHIQVSAGYFQVIGLPLLRGRLLTPDDHARRVAIVTDRTARTLWPDQDALGRSFRRGRSDTWEVVGIVADSRIRGFERDPGLVAYVPYGINTRNGLSLVLKGTVSESTTIDSARRAVRAIDPELPLQHVRTMDAVVDEALAMRRFQVRLITGFAAAALLLACLGIYGVLSGMVEGRRSELAIRLALGASPARVRRLIVWQGLPPVIAGLVIGLAAGVGAARLASTLLFGVTPAHPAVLGAVTAIVLSVAIAACVEPAVRAARTPSASALRGT